MSTNHTPGRLAIDSGDLYAENIGNVAGYQVAIVNHEFSDFPAEVIDANARRLAACWNAFEGMATEDIEAMVAAGGPMPVLALSESADAMRAQLALPDTLAPGIFSVWRALRRAQDAHSDMMEALELSMRCDCPAPDAAQAPQEDGHAG